MSIEFKKVSKRFGNFYANRELSFKVQSGTIHGLIGENGAGKSTAMKILFGLQTATEGEIFYLGKKIQFSSSVQAMKAGIGMVHQHFMLAGPETVLDNIMLGHEVLSFGFWLNRTQVKKELHQISEHYGLGFKKWDAKITELSVGEQQKVEIIKLLYQKSNVLILDEPTAVLTPQEIQTLFVNLRKLKEEGKTIIIISHKLKEILELTDEVTVMRKGEGVGTLPTQQATEDILAEMMVGRKVSFTYEGIRKMLANTESLRPLLKVRDLSVPSSEPLSHVSFEVKPGEIVGVGGVQGNGQSTLLKFLTNPYSFEVHSKIKVSGRYEIHGQHANYDRPEELRKRGVGWVPEDRHLEGLLLQENLVENFLLGQQHDPRYTWNQFGIDWLNRKAVRATLENKIHELDIRPVDTRTLTEKMSGGNQQKLLLARALDPKPTLLFIAHPTRGVDVGAIEKIHDLMMYERNQGRGILLFSSELDELIDLADRTLIFYEGKIQGEFHRRNYDAWEMGRVMGGGLVSNKAMGDKAMDKEKQ